MKKTILILLISVATIGTAFAGFINGGFEDGDLSLGWTNGSGNRNSPYTVNNYSILPSQFLPDGSHYTNSYLHSARVSQGTDPNVPTSMVYSGSYAARIEDTISGGYASAITQRVNNWNDNNIFFAWKGIMLGAHGPSDAATFVLTLKDETNGDILVNRQYNAASGGGGVDPRFTYYNGWYYTADWQIESLDTSSRLGHDFSLSLLASDCSPTAHPGYVYLDGFGNVIPPVGVPEPGTLLLLGIGLVGLVGYGRKK